MLAQRAAFEGPRWTRAVEDPSGPTPKRERSFLIDLAYLVDFSSPGLSG
jgi:hypothetical protein